MTQSDLDTATLIRRLTEDLDACKALLESFRTSAAHYQNSYGSAVKELDALRNTLAGFQLELDAKKAESERLRAQLTESLSQTERAIEQRDEQRARAEDADAELARVRDLFGKEFAFVRDQLNSARVELREARRERDKALDAQARSERLCNEQRVRAEKAEADFAAARKECDEADGITSRALSDWRQIANERDEARAQLAAIEWSALRRPDSGGTLSACCPICQGVKPGHEFGSAFKLEQVGHRADCWFARQNAAIPAGTMAAGSQVRIAVGFKPKPAHPEPRFKVGQMVFTPHDKACAIMTASWLEGWRYTVAFEGFGVVGPIPESDLRPAPKFAVGEWVTHRLGSGEIKGRSWDEKLQGWFYAIDGFTNLAEAALTAQTPQHEHDCEGCVFLGRMGDKDLYHDKAGHCGYCFVSLGPVIKSYFGVDCDGHTETEAIRRAKLRGLVQ